MLVNLAPGSDPWDIFVAAPEGPDASGFDRDVRAY